MPSSSETSPSPFIDSLTVDPGACSVLGGALGVSGGFLSSDAPYTIEKMRTASHPLAFEAYISCWAVTKDSLLLKDIAAQEWSYCAHPPATMKLLVAQSSARMVVNLRYATAQTSALMVVAADLICRHGINETQLKTLQDVVASLKGELRDSEAERRRLFEQYCIVAYEKATLEDHVAILEDQAERLESQVSSLARKNGVLVRGLARCRHQLARA